MSNNNQVNPWHPTILLLPCLFLTLFFIKKWFTTNPTKILPPSPPQLPIIGNLHQLISNPHKALHTLAQKHGPLMLLHLGNIPLLVVSSPDLAQKILKTHDPIFSNRPKSSAASGIYDCKDIAFAPFGEYWRNVKGICVNHLLSNKKVQSFGKVREEEVFLMIEKIRESSCFENVVVNLGETFASLTNDIICRVALGRKYSDGEGGRRFKEVLERLGVLLGRFDVGEFIPWLFWIKYVNGIDGEVRKVAKEIDEFLEFVVKDHKEEKGRSGKDGDFVDVLLEIQRKNESGCDLDDVSLKAVILDMFAAGTDTTFTLIEWILSELIRNKDVMLKLRNELESISRDGSFITEENLAKCRYLKSVVKETLRIHPPLPLLVPHESTQEVKLLGYNIGAGTRVIVNVWAIGRDPSVWENADHFLPERFLNSDMDVKGQHFELVPFGAGRRGCPGTSFAMGIVELAIANLVVNFDFSLPGGVRGEDLNMTEGDGLTIHRKFSLCVRVRCRSSVSL